MYVDRGKYFVINRGRQYGKITTLKALGDYLKEDYLVVSMDFQGIGSEDFVSAERFVEAFAKKFLACFSPMPVGTEIELLKPLTEFVEIAGNRSLLELFVRLSAVCKMAGKLVVLMIDEVDSASNNQVFIDFLAQHREYYLNRETKETFWSVILAGVYDIKNLKLKIRQDSEHQYNSPWNTREANEENGCLHTVDECSRNQIAYIQFDIAADFDVEMAFSVKQIEGMLQEYEVETHTGMDAVVIAEEIYQYTSGYPYLVSMLCKMMDEKLPEQEIFTDNAEIWSRRGVAEAVKILMSKQLPLFQSMFRQLSEYPALKRMSHALLFQGKRITFNPDNPVIELAAMFGYIVNREGVIQSANRIFEMRLYGYFLSEEELTSAIYDEAQGNRDSYFRNGKLDMEALLGKFV